jgi:tetratricopeptide (TPR) repeat protein
MDIRRMRYSSLVIAALLTPALSATAGAQSGPMHLEPKRATVVGGVSGGIADGVAGGVLAFALAGATDDRADDLYERARDLIDDGKFERALGDLERLIELKSNRTDAALYWKAYSLSKLGRKADALTALSDFQQKFKDSRWAKDARALDLEVRQSSGQAVSPESQNDEELKLMALRALMNSDPDRAIPIIEQMLAGTNSPKVKDRALFVLSQSGSARAREIIGNVAKGGSNPDLQLRAIKYLGVMGGGDNRQILADVYRASTDPAVKRTIIRSFMVAGDRARLLGLAKGETNADLRGDAVQQLGVMGAHAELADL